MSYESCIRGKNIQWISTFQILAASGNYISSTYGNVQRSNSLKFPLLLKGRKAHVFVTTWGCNILQSIQRKVKLTLQITHRCAETATTNCTTKFSEWLPSCTGGVKAFSQQDYTVQKEEGGQTIDDVLKILNTTGERERHVKLTDRSKHKFPFDTLKSFIQTCHFIFFFILKLEIMGK